MQLASLGFWAAGKSGMDIHGYEVSLTMTPVNGYQLSVATTPANRGSQLWGSFLGPLTK